MKNIKLTKNEQYITTGALAKLAHIGRDTLIFYIRTGLIEPAYTGSNGYKYFLPEQVQTINFIRFYRKLDFSLEAISEMLENHHSKHNPQELSSTLSSQRDILSRRIQSLQKAMDYLTWEQNFQEYLNAHQPDTVFIERLKEETMYITPIRFRDSLNEPDHARLVADFFMDTKEEFHAPEHPICCIVHKERFLESDVTIDNSQHPMTVAFPDSDTNNRKCTRPAGLYACMIHTGDSGSIPSTIHHILDTLAKDGTAVTGNGFVINSCDFLNVTQATETQYLVQIEIAEQKETDAAGV